MQNVYPDALWLCFWMWSFILTFWCWLLAARESAVLHKVVGNIEQREPLFGCNILKYEEYVISSLFWRHFQQSVPSTCGRSCFDTLGDINWQINCLKESSRCGKRTWMKGKFIRNQLWTFWLKTQMSVSRTYRKFCDNINDSR